MEDIRAGKFREAAEMLASGLSIAKTAAAIGVSRSTLSDWKCAGRLPEVRPASGVAAGAMKDMEIAALKTKLKLAEGSAPVITPKYVPSGDASPEAKWKAAELDNAEHIRKALLMAHFSVELQESKPVALVFISDQHISLGNCVDLERMRQDAELVAATEGAYAILGGDFVDNHIKHRAAVLAARSQPQEQYELAEWYLEIFAHRVLVAISGNHDLWTNQIAGLDVLSGLCKRQGVCYAPDEALLKVHLGTQEYKVGIRHQYRMNSSFNETHVVKQWFRNGEGEWDIGCVGHHHVSAIEPFWGHGVERWACRPGSYQITSAYSRQFGFNKTRPLCPGFVIHPKERKIVGFHQMADAFVYLKAARES